MYKTMIYSDNDLVQILRVTSLVKSTQVLTGYDAWQSQISEWLHNQRQKGKESKK